MESVNFYIYKGESFYAELTYSSAVEITQSFVAASDQNSVTLSHSPIVLDKSSKKYLCSVLINGEPETNFTVEGSELFFKSTPEVDSSITVTYQYSDPVVFTGGVSAKMSINTPQGVAVYSLTDLNGITITSPGSITLSIDGATTAGFDTGNHYYDLLLEDTYVKTILKGKFKVRKSETIL